MTLSGENVDEVRNKTELLRDSQEPRRWSRTGQRGGRSQSRVTTRKQRD